MAIYTSYWALVEILSVDALGGWATIRYVKSGQTRLYPVSYLKSSGGIRELHKAISRAQRGLPPAKEESAIDYQAKEGVV